MQNLSEEKLIQIVDAAIEKNSKIISMDARLTSVETRLTSVETRLTSVETRLTSVETRLTSVETKLLEIGILLEQVRDSVSLIAEAVMPLINRDKQIQSFDKTLIDHSNEIIVTQQVVKDHINDKRVHVSKQT